MHIGRNCIECTDVNMDDVWDVYDVHVIVSNRLEIVTPVLFGDYFLLATLAPTANRFQSAHHCPQSIVAANLAS